MVKDVSRAFDGRGYHFRALSPGVACCGSLCRLAFEPTAYVKSWRFHVPRRCHLSYMALCFLFVAAVSRAFDGRGYHFRALSPGVACCGSLCRLAFEPTAYVKSWRFHVPRRCHLSYMALCFLFVAAVSRAFDGRGYHFRALSPGVACCGSLCRLAFEPTAYVKSWRFHVPRRCHLSYMALCFLFVAAVSRAFDGRGYHFRALSPGVACCGVPCCHAIKRQPT